MKDREEIIFKIKSLEWFIADFNKILVFPDYVVFKDGDLERSQPLSTNFPKNIRAFLLAQLECELNKLKKEFKEL